MAATLPALTHQLQPIIALATDAVTPPHTHRAYSRGLADFLVWVEQARPAGLTKATVPASSLNQRLTAIRKLAAEWVIVDLIGKRNKTRSVPMPNWTKASGLAVPMLSVTPDRVL